MGRDAAIRLLRVLVARGLRPDAPMADATIRNIAVEAALDNEFDVARNYALQQGWLVIGAHGGRTHIVEFEEGAFRIDAAAGF
jgi:hypothetical protein